MNKTKKYLILFLAVCFVFIVSVGIKQTFWSNQADNQVISHKEEKKTAAKTNENDVKATQENDENETSVQESKTENEEESKSTTDTSQTTNKTSEKKSTNQSSSTQQNSNITAQPSKETQNNSSKPVETVSYNLVIKGKGSYVLQENITIQDGQTVYDVLLSATKQHHIEFQAIESQYGMYVVNIGGLKAANYGGNANNGWVYEINGSHVGTSADKKILKSTDQIEWIYLY